MNSDAGRRRMETAGQKMTEALVRASGMQPDQDPDEPSPKRSRESTAEEGDVATGGGGEASGSGTAVAEPPKPWPAIEAREQLLRKRKAEIEAEDSGRGDPHGLPADAPASVRAAVLGKDSRKRHAEFDADDSGRGEEPQVENATPEMEAEATSGISAVRQMRPPKALQSYICWGRNLARIVDNIFLWLQWRGFGPR